MKLETFFEKFDQFADAPNAVAKMRELLLSFAVTGRLSEPRADDAPVSELIDALSDARARRGKTGRRGAPAALPPESVIDRPIDAPVHWAWVPLNEIGAMSGGMTPSKAKSDFWDGDMNWFSSKDIKTDELTESELKITREATDATGLQVYSPGCIVMVARSGILKRTFPVSILRVEGTVNQDLKVLSPFVGGIERYLQIMLRGMTNFILTSLVKTGMTVQSLKYEEFEAQSFPLPPLAEQKRIVTKVDELMALCDRLEAQQQEREKKHAALARAALARFADAPTPANLNFLFHQSYAIPPADLRKSILTLAVQGKLVPQDPNDEPAEELLVKIVAEKKRLASLDELKADKKAWVNSSANPPYDIPDSWCWVRLQDVFEISRGGSPRPAGDPRFFGGPIPWITVGEVTKDAGKYLTQTETGLTVEGSKRSRFIDPGDLLLTNSGATLGVPKISRIRGCMNDGVAVLRLFHPFDLNDFGYLYLTQQTPAFRNVNQGMGQPNLNTPIIAGWFFPIPPLAEQRRIVAKVDQLMALVDELEQQLAASRATGEKLLVALVAELTGTPTSGKASVPSSTAGRRGHPRK